MVGSTLSAAVLLAVLSSYLYLGRQLVRLSNQQTLETEARRALGFFTRDAQKAARVDTTAILSATRVSLVIPTDTRTDIVTYYYNNTSAPVSVTVNGSNISMPANALTRCAYNGTTVTSLTLLSNITDNNTGTANDLAISYFDSAGSEYTSYADYLPGIKQLAIKFSTQMGVANNGTLTPVLQTGSSRLVLRNSAFLQ